MGRFVSFVRCGFISCHIILYRMIYDIVMGDLHCTTTPSRILVPRGVFEPLAIISCAFCFGLPSLSCAGGLGASSWFLLLAHTYYNVGHPGYKHG